MTAEEKRLRALLTETAEMLGKFPTAVPRLMDDGTYDGYTQVLPLYTKIMKALERSEASKRGKSNRSRGHYTETMVVNYLKEWFPDAATTRSLLGHDGTRQPGDVWFAPAVVLSVKHVKTPAWPAWLREVNDEAREAGGWEAGFSPRVPAVVHRTLGETDVGKWPCAVPLGSWDGVIPSVVDARRWGDYSELLDEWHLAVGDWINHQYKTPGVAVMRFATFAEAFRLDR